MTDDVSVVHNGIIENYRELKEELIAEGAAFTSDTDTEVIAHLVTRELKAETIRSAPRFARSPRRRVRHRHDLPRLQRSDDRRSPGEPLAIGYGKGEMFVGQMRWRSRPSPMRSAISRTATGRC